VLGATSENLDGAWGWYDPAQTQVGPASFPTSSTVENRLCARRRSATAKTVPGVCAAPATPPPVEKGTQVSGKKTADNKRGRNRLPGSSVCESSDEAELRFDCVADFLARVFAIALANWYQRTIANAS
jgi:hypothetical protein